MASTSGERIAYPNTIFGFHTPADDEEDIFLSRYLELFRKHQLPPLWLERRDDEMIYFSPQDALKYRIIDTIKNTTLLKE